MKFGFGYGGSYESRSGVSKLNATKSAEKAKPATKLGPSKRSGTGRVSNSGKTRTVKSPAGNGVSDKPKQKDTGTGRKKLPSSSLPKVESKEKPVRGHNNSKSTDVAGTTKKCSEHTSVEKPAPKPKKKPVGKEVQKKHADKIFKWFEENGQPHRLVSLSFNYDKIIRVIDRHQNEALVDLDREYYLVNFKTKKILNYGVLWESGIDTKDDVPWTEKDDGSETKESNKG